MNFKLFLQEAATHAFWAQSPVICFRSEVFSPIFFNYMFIFLEKNNLSHTKLLNYTPIHHVTTLVTASGRSFVHLQPNLAYSASSVVDRLVVRRCRRSLVSLRCCCLGCVAHVCLFVWVCCCRVSQSAIPTITPWYINARYQTDRTQCLRTLPSIYNA